MSQEESGAEASGETESWEEESDGPETEDAGRRETEEAGSEETERKEAEPWEGNDPENGEPAEE